MSKFSLSFVLFQSDCLVSCSELLSACIFHAVFKDKNTPSPFIETFPNDDGEAAKAAKPDYIYMDAMGFGMGNCCLQVKCICFQCYYTLSSLSTLLFKICLMSTFTFFNWCIVHQSGKKRDKRTSGMSSILVLKSKYVGVL